MTVSGLKDLVILIPSLPPSENATIHGGDDIGRVLIPHRKGRVKTSPFLTGCRPASLILLCDNFVKGKIDSLLTKPLL
jgi:hypothetical protein